MVVVQMTVTLDDDGHVNLNAEGPGSDSLVNVLGLLALAQQAVMDSRAQPQQQPILPGAFTPVPRNGFRRGARGV